MSPLRDLLAREPGLTGKPLSPKLEQGVLPEADERPGLDIMQLRLL